MSPRKQVGLVSGVVPFTATKPAAFVSERPLAVTTWRHLGMPPTGLVAGEEMPRRVVEPEEVGLFGFMGALLTAPITLPAWGLKKIAEAAEEQAREYSDVETRLRGGLLENRMRYESGEITEEEYREREAELQRRLKGITR